MMPTPPPSANGVSALARHGPLVFVTVSTGIGGGVISDNRIVHGRRGLTVKSANAITNESERCHCGGGGLLRGGDVGHGPRPACDGSDKARRRLGVANAVPRQGGDGRHVVETARGGDEAALGLIDREAHWLGIGFTNLLHLYSPDTIVMGGGISHGYDPLRKPLEATIQNERCPLIATCRLCRRNSVGMPA
ncbi:ROK family protein [Rhizobium beringeri]